MTQARANVREFAKIYAELYGYLMRIPGARFVLSGAGWSVPLPLPGSHVWLACAALRRDAVAR